MGKDLEPEIVSLNLDLLPDQAHRRGDPNIGKSGRQYSDFSEGLWALRSPLDEAASLDNHLSYIIEKLNGRGRAIRELEALGYRLDIFIGVFGEDSGNLGFSISGNVLCDLAAFCIKLEFDVYD